MPTEGEEMTWVPQANSSNTLRENIVGESTTELTFRKTGKRR